MCTFCEYIMEHSHKKVEENLFSPLDISHSFGEVKNPTLLNCPAVSGTLEEDIDQNSSQDFSTWREHDVREWCTTQLTKTVLLQLSI